MLLYFLLLLHCSCLCCFHLFVSECSSASAYSEYLFTYSCTPQYPFTHSSSSSYISWDCTVFCHAVSCFLQYGAAALSASGRPSNVVVSSKSTQSCFTFQNTVGSFHVQLSEFDPFPVDTICQNCQQAIVTVVRYRAGRVAFLTCGLMGLLTCGL